MPEMNPKQPASRLRLMLIIAVIFSITMGFTFWHLMNGDRRPFASTLLLLPEARTIEDFSLVDHAGEAFTPENLRGRWSLIFFGFTNCPDVCPGALYDLNLVSENLAGYGENEALPQVVLVSVDPERDSPEKLKQYVRYFNPGFIGVTGGEKQLAEMTAQLGVPYQVEDHEPGDPEYAVYHSASILVTDPSARLRGAFPPPHDAAAMAQDLRRLID
jgi:protein SCO1/2